MQVELMKIRLGDQFVVKLLKISRIVLNKSYLKMLFPFSEIWKMENVTIFAKCKKKKRQIKQ